MTETATPPNDSDDLPPSSPQRPPSSRIIVRNVPRHTTKAQLCSHVERQLGSNAGSITEIRMMHTADGKFREFAFIGLVSPEAAAVAVKRVNGTFLNTRRLFADFARPPGDSNLPRAWSQHTEGSSAHERRKRAQEEKLGGIKTADAVSTDVEDDSDCERKKSTSSGGGGVPEVCKCDGEEELDAFIEGAVVQSTNDTAGSGDERGVSDSAIAKSGSADELKNTLDVDAETELIRKTKRLLVLNLPYKVDEKQLKSYIQPEPVETHICRALGDNHDGASLGRAFVQFESAVQALEAYEWLDRKIHFGRLLRVRAAEAQKPSEKVVKVGGEPSSYKKRKLEEKKREASRSTKQWNLLYVSSTAVVASATGGDSKRKQELLKLDENSGDGGDAAVSVALAEQELLKLTRDWLAANHVNPAAFERRGFDLLKAQPLPERAQIPRADDAFIVKHLPAGTTAQALHNLLGRAGPVVRLNVAPSGTVAVVQYLLARDAQKAFVRFAYAPFKDGAPLLLEWAPSDVFLADKPQNVLPSPPPETAVSQAQTTADGELQKIRDLLDADDRAGAIPVSLHVKNLNFATSADGFRSLFENISGFVKATIKRKKTAHDEYVSAGYGFVEFKDAHSATNCLKRMQGVSLDGHALQLSVSDRAPAIRAIGGTPSTTTDAGVLPEGLDISKVTNKLTVRNLAFQATAKDVRKLFEAFGSVVAVRTPKKADGQRRGFGFVEFATRSDAVAALEALQGTHLYGRRLVLEVAKGE